jgi:hypothetical protein
LQAESPRAVSAQSCTGNGLPSMEVAACSYNPQQTYGKHLANAYLAARVHLDSGHTQTGLVVHRPWKTARLYKHARHRLTQTFLEPTRRLDDLVHVNAGAKA